MSCLAAVADADVGVHKIRLLFEALGIYVYAYAEVEYYGIVEVAG